jgi:predicted dehydrogenase
MANMASRKFDLAAASTNERSFSVNSPGVSRRQFVVRAAKVAATGLVAPYYVPCEVLAAPGRAGANDRIGVGYIGVGHRGAQLMNLPADARIVAVCDVNQTRCEEVAKSKACRSFQDYRRLLDDKVVDAVVIATPEHWHALPFIRACQAGKDIYCEKPLGLTIREGQMMVAAARKYDRVVQIGTQQRSMQANRMGWEAVRGGRIGKVHTVISSEYASPWDCRFVSQPVPLGLDWDAWCGQIAFRPFHSEIYPAYGKPGWTSLRRYSGGRMTGWGAHGLDQVQWVLGMEKTGPVEVWVEGDQFTPPTYTEPETPHRGIKICKRPAVRFRYANGVLVKLDGGTTWGGVFLGERGKIKIDRGVFQLEPEGTAKIQPQDDHYKAGDDHLAQWLRCVKSRQQPVADVEAVHRSTTVCHLCNIARWLGRKLRWDPERETFPGDNEANSYLHRPQRKPYQIPKTI